MKDTPARRDGSAAGDGTAGGVRRSSTRHSAFHALRYRNFRLFFIGQLISVAGSWMQTVAQQWLVYSITHSSAWLGIVSGASAIPYVACSMWGGKVADHHERRTVLVWTQAAMMVQAFILSFLVWNRWVPVQAWHIAVLAAMAGVVNAFNMPAQQAFVTEMVDDREALGNAIALNSLRFNLARFLGPIFAGVVLVKMGAAMCFFLNALSFIAVIVSLLMMSLPPFEPQESDESMWGGFAYIWRTAAVLRTIALLGAGSLFAWSASTLFPAIAAAFGKGAGGFSTIMSLNGVGAALGGLAIAVFGERVPRRTLVYGGALLFGGALLGLSVVPASGYHAALGMLVLSGFAMIVFGISCNTMVQESVPDRVRGRVMAVYSLVFAGLMPVGGLEVGFLADKLHSPMLAVRLNAGLCLVTAVGLLLWSQADRRRARQAAESPAASTGG